jgi:hydroxyethylthiazole kinase-like sugar kinase family protein
MKTWYDDALRALNIIREQSPRVTFLTNSSEEYFLSSICRSLGSYALFPQGVSEFDDFIRRSTCVVIDLAAAERFGQKALLMAAGVAKRKRIPWFFLVKDADISKSRRFIAKTLQLQKPLQIIGTADEVKKMNGGGLRFLFQNFLGLVSSSQMAIISDNLTTLYHNRKSLRIRTLGSTGVWDRSVLGISAIAAVMASVQATDIHSRRAAIDGSILFYAALKCAESMTKGPASLVPIFIDALYHLRSEHMLKYVALDEEDFWD